VELAVATLDDDLPVRPAPMRVRAHQVRACVSCDDPSFVSCRQSRGFLRCQAPSLSC
jgi:hypothetical protein